MGISNSRRAALAVIVAAALAGGVALMGGRPTAARPLAELDAEQPHVEVGASASGPWQVAARKALRAGEVVRTDRTGAASIRYFDGSVTRLGPRTEFSIQRLEDANGRSIVGRLDVGKTFHRVQKLSTSGARFEVRTANAVAAVRGTQFSVVCLVRNVCEVAVTEGAVAVADLRGNSHLVRAGHQVTIGRSGLIGSVEPLDSANPWIIENLALIDAARRTGPRADGEFGAGERPEVLGRTVERTGADGTGSGVSRTGGGSRGTGGPSEAGDTTRAGRSDGGRNNDDGTTPAEFAAGPPAPAGESRSNETETGPSAASGETRRSGDTSRRSQPSTDDDGRSEPRDQRSAETGARPSNAAPSGSTTTTTAQPPANGQSGTTSTTQPSEQGGASSSSSTPPTTARSSTPATSSTTTTTAAPTTTTTAAPTTTTTAAPTTTTTAAPTSPTSSSGRPACASNDPCGDDQGNGRPRGGNSSNSSNSSAGTDDDGGRSRGRDRNDVIAGPLAPGRWTTPELFLLGLALLAVRRYRARHITA